MKFGLMFANTGPFSHPESLARLAQTAFDFIHTRLQSLLQDRIEHGTPACQ